MDIGCIIVYYLYCYSITQIKAYLWFTGDEQYIVLYIFI